MTKPNPLDGVTYEVAAREVTVRLTDAPDLPGVTSGLRERTVVPNKVVFTHHSTSGTVYAEGTGPSRKADGTVSATWYTVKVRVSQLDGSVRMYPAAPAWVSALWEKVEA